MGLRLIVLSLFLVSLVPYGTVFGEPFPLGKTFFQTNSRFDPRIALPSDFVVVHRHGAPDIGESLSSWNREGYPSARMFFIGSDAGRKYTLGGDDGQDRLGEAETRRNGTVIECAGVRPYMIPTTGWTDYIREMTSFSIEQGAQGVFPEEPLAHTQSGYSESFKGIWKERYHEDWKPPHSSPEHFWKASKLKSDLYYELVEATLDETLLAEARLGEEIPFVLPIHSLLSHAAGNMVYPSGRSLNLIDKGLDGFVGQVWTGPIAWSMSRSEGRRMTRDEDFFESAYLLYSYFANLTYGTDVPCFMLADPVEDDPQYTWDDYKDWYEKSLVTMLLFPWVDHFELMPWPDRVFLPGHTMGGGSPGPEDYRRTLVSVFEALREISHTPVNDFSKTSGPIIGCLVNDTLGWQRGGPHSSRMESIHGLTVPLLKRGIPIQVVPLERSDESRYLDRFNLLVLSYDSIKPLTHSRNRHLVDWVKRGGILLYVGETNPYDEIPSWWKQEGFESPADHLRSLLDAAGIAWVSPSNSVFPLETGNLGKGRVGWIDSPSTQFAESPEWAMHYLALLTQFFADQGIDLYQGKPIVTRRGPYVAARTTQATLLLTGWFINLLDPDLRVLKDPAVDRNSFAFYKEVKAPAMIESPELLFSGPEPLSSTSTRTTTSYQYRAPDSTPLTIRLGSGGRELRSVSLKRNREVSPLEKLYDPDSFSYLIRAEVGWKSGQIEFEWAPE